MPPVSLMPSASQEPDRRECRFCRAQVGSVQDLADVIRILGLANDQQLDVVRAVFAKYEPDGTDDLESLIRLGKLEIGEQN